MNQIITSLKQGAKLKPMQSTGNCLEDGFVLEYKKNNLTGITEVMTGDVLSLERKGLIFWNAGLWRYVLSKKGERI